MNNLTSLAWWQPKPPAPQLDPKPALTPEQIILAAFKIEHLLTQGMLLDLCRQNGVNLSYHTLRSHLAQLQQQGIVQSHFSQQVIPGLGVLVYQRSSRPAFPLRT